MYNYIPKNYAEWHSEICEEPQTDIHKVCVALESLLEAKQEYYGTDNLCRYGHYGVMVRIADKLSRLENLIRKLEEEEPGNVDTEEALYDVYRDIAGYGVMAIKLMKDRSLTPRGKSKGYGIGNVVSVIVNGLSDHGRILDVHTIDDNEDLIYVIESSNGARIYVPEEDIKGLIE